MSSGSTSIQQRIWIRSQRKEAQEEQILGKKRIWSLGYADDIVLVEKNREEIKDMIDRLCRFLKEKKIVIMCGKNENLGICKIEKKI